MLQGDYKISWTFSIGRQRRTPLSVSTRGRSIRIGSAAMAVSTVASSAAGRPRSSASVPRSSTFRKWGILQANSMGVIDESYCGDDDVWGFPALAMRDTTIARGDRICQFRVMRKMDKPELVTVEHLDNASRGGFGSTGTR